MFVKLLVLLSVFTLISAANETDTPSLYFQGVESRNDVGSKLMGKSHTDWGKWSGWAFCKEHMWAVGAQLRVEKHQGSGAFGGDDSGLNAVRLMCAPLGEFGVRWQSAEPHEGLWGDWKDEVFCPESLVTGFDLQSEKNQGGGDDTAANNLRLMCSNQRDMQLNGHNWGEWMGMQVCPKGEAVCGVQVLFEGNQGSGDDTAVNNVNLACCKVHMKPEDTCTTANDVWETILDCDSKGSSAGLKCDYSKTVGITTSKTDSTTRSEAVEKSLQLSLEVGAQSKHFSAKFSETVGTSKKTGYDWTSAQSESFNSATTIATSYDVPPYKRVKMQQVVGKCGAIDVRTPSFRIVDV